MQASQRYTVELELPVIGWVVVGLFGDPRIALGIANGAQRLLAGQMRQLAATLPAAMRWSPRTASRDRVTGRFELFPSVTTPLVQL